MHTVSRTIIPILLLTLIAGCANSSTSPGGLPMTPMRIGNKTFQLEIAADDTSREKGLMERDSMQADHGMIFVFQDCEKRSFWMHHTRFPLDIIYADDQAKVVSTHTMKAYDESATWSAGPAQYAIELNAGELAATGVKSGDKLDIPSAIRSK